MSSDKKIEVRESISYDDFETVRAIVDREANRYGLKYQDFTIQVDEEYGSHRPVLVYFRPETDAEREIREIMEKQMNANREKFEREQYDRLKKKFEGENN